MSKAKVKSGQPEECNIQVALRCRPRNEDEKTSNSPSIIECSSAKSQIDIKIKQGVRVDSKTYTFDRVFGPESTQVEVYQGVVEPILDEVLMGYNCTVFAYGQTGTGKTHTMEGYRSEHQYASYLEDPGSGIIPRALHQLFEKLEVSGNEFSVRVSFLEIYNEELFDLLCVSDEKKLKLFDDGRAKGSVLIQGLEEIAVQSKEEVYDIMAKGAERRRTGETKMNKCSSRSHSIFVVTIHQKENNINGEEVVKTGKLYMVDLAGSENIGRSGAVKDRAREAGSINQSLLTLGRVINKLVEHSQHIPYRESKLTRILQDSLGGRTKTSIIATISPAAINFEETLSTLDYALRAKSILNRPEVNQKLTKKALIKEFNEEIERLKKDLQACREKNGIYLSQEHYQHLQSQAEAQQGQIDELMERIEAMKDEMTKTQSLFDEAKVDLARVAGELATTKDELRNTGEKLDETSRTLVATEKDRDAHKYLVQHHVEVEEVLHTEAEKARSTAETSVTHVSLLHNKVQRQRAVESSNLEAAAEFQQDVSRRVGAMQESIGTFVSAQVSSLFALHSSVNQYASTSEQSFESMRRLLNGSCSEAKAACGQMQAGVRGLGEESAAWAAQEQRHADEETAVATQGVETMIQSFVRAPTAHVDAMLQQQQAAVSDLAHAVHAWAAGLTEAVTGFAAQQQQRLVELEAMVQSQARAMDEERQAQQAAMAQLAEAQRGALAQAASAMQDTVTQMLTSMLQSQQQAMAAAVQACVSKNAQASERQSAFLSSFQSSLASAAANSQSHADGVQQHVAQGEELVRSHAEAADGVCDTERAYLAQTQLEAAAALGQYTAQQQQRTATAAVRIRAHQVALAAHVATADTALTALQDKVDESTSSTVAALTESQQQTRAATAGWAATAAAGRESAEEMRVSMLAQLGDAGSTVSDFAQNKFKRNVVTGETPQRQPYEFPRSFTRSRSHEQLLKEFEAAEGRPDTSKSTLAGTEGGKENDSEAVKSKLPVFAPARRQLGQMNTE